MHCQPVKEAYTPDGSYFIALETLLNILLDPGMVAAGTQIGPLQPVPTAHHQPLR